uniref:NADH-ubiquinone oxidoreductase chain 3 n=1 Tax=Amblyseius obtuserellus TaxID=3061186 RepID=A0AAU6PCL7_9ACAR
MLINWGLFYMMKMVICFLIAVGLYMASFLSLLVEKNSEKLFSFECGFSPILSPRVPFSIQFFKILLIFLLFDMEIIIVLPLPMFLSKGVFSVILITVILLVIILGLFFEMMDGNLKWLK